MGLSPLSYCNAIFFGYDGERGTHKLPNAAVVRWLYVFGRAFLLEFRLAGLLTPSKVQFTSQPLPSAIFLAPKRVPWVVCHFESKYYCDRHRPYHKVIIWAIGGTKAAQSSLVAFSKIILTAL